MFFNKTGWRGREGRETSAWLFGKISVVVGWTTDMQEGVPMSKTRISGDSTTQSTPLPV